MSHSRFVRFVFERSKEIFVRANETQMLLGKSACVKMRIENGSIGKVENG